MESLTDTKWDVIISGTGIAQSLLALCASFLPPIPGSCLLTFISKRALSRSDKKILHVDQNPYYGGPDAALSLQDAEEWVTKVNQGVELVCLRDAPTFADCDSIS